MKVSLQNGLVLFACIVGCGGSDAGSIGNASSGGTSSEGSGSGSGSGAEDPLGSGKDGPADLFDAPSSPSSTPDSILGLWGGAKEDVGMSFDLRYKFTPSSITVALKCTKDTGDTATASVTVAARVADVEIAILESKKDKIDTGKVSCEVNLAPVTAKPCASDGIKIECFDLAGRELAIIGRSPLDKVELTKLSD